MKFKTGRKYARIWPQEGDQLDRLTSANGTLSHLVQLLAHLHFNARISVITQKVIMVSAGSSTFDIFCGATSQSRLRPPHPWGLRSRTTHHSPFDSSWRVISTSQRPLPDNTQHSQKTDIDDPGGIRTRNLSRRAVADLRLRSRGHWDRLIIDTGH